MMFFDMFFSMIYRFSNQKLKRDTDNATFSAAAIMMIYIGFFANSVAHMIGIIKDNAISRWSLDNAFLSSALIGGCAYIMFLIRYFNFISEKDIKKRVAELPDTKRIIYQCLIYLVLIAVPIESFVFYRLYMFGYV